MGGDGGRWGRWGEMGGDGGRWGGDEEGSEVTNLVLLFEWL